MKYVHFTSPEDAQKIVEAGFLWQSSIIQGAIYAVAQGGVFSPGVQRTNLGRTKDRSVAVVFETKDLPDVAFPEEVIWHMDRLPIYNAEIVPAEEAVKLLDGSVPTDENDWLKIPVHPSKMDVKTWERVRENVNAKKAMTLTAIAHQAHHDRLRKLRR